MTAVLAMLYLILFSSLAVGFYTATNTAFVVTDNERRMTMAQTAAESGMDFVRFQLAQIVIPHGTSKEELFPLVSSELRDALENTGNLGASSVGVTDTLVTIPADPNAFVPLGADGTSFRATVENLGQKLRVKVVGRYQGLEVMRAVQMDYDLAEKASHIFDYGVASRGRVYTAGAARIRGATDPKKGSVLSTSTSAAVPVEIRGKEVSGDISITNPAGSVVFSGASIGGTSDPTAIVRDHIHVGVPEPEFPTVDTEMFRQYATNVYAGGNTLTNAVIRANTNPKFTGGATINGVLFVEAPNNIEFRGNTVVNGLIVVQNAAPGTLATNVLNFSGNVTANPVPDTLDPELRKLTGSFILAPKFHVMFSGSFGAINGSIIADKVSMTGNATGVIMGSVLNMADTQMTVNGSAEIIIASTGTTNYPAGVFFSSRYVPLPDTYTEVKP